jgi:hypothetical protein
MMTVKDIQLEIQKLEHEERKALLSSLMTLQNIQVAIENLNSDELKQLRDWLATSERRSTSVLFQIFALALSILGLISVIFVLFSRR